MNERQIQLLDANRVLVATALAADEGDHFGGTIDLGPTPAPLRALFGEFEEIVNGQLFSFLDEIQDKIDAMAISAVFEDGSEACISDLQVYPSTRGVSFRLGRAACSR